MSLSAVLQKQDTIDSLDMFENDDDEDKICYPVPDPAGFGFSQSMELDDPPKYEITPPIEGTRTNSAVVVRFQQDKSRRANGLEFDNIGFKEEDEDENNRSGNDKRNHQPRLSTKERRAQFQALKTMRNEQKRANEKLKPDRVRETDNHPRNRHRKVERLSKHVDHNTKSRGSKKNVVRQNNVHTVQAEVENEDLGCIPNVIVDTPSSTSKSINKTKRADNSNTSSSKKAERTNVASQESSLRGARYDSIREKVMHEMSSVGSSELYDIPEDPAEDSFDTGSSPYQTFDGSLTSETDIQISGESLRLEELDVSKLRSTDSQETVPIGGENGGNDDIEKRLSFQFSLSISDGGKSDNESDYCFPAVGVASIDYGMDGAPTYLPSKNEPDTKLSFDSNFSDSISSKSSAKEMRELYKKSKSSRSLLNTLQSDNIQQDIVYL